MSRQQYIEFTTDKDFVRRRRELRTIEAMVRMYCRHHHGGRPLCPDCTELMQYASVRLERCVFGDAKPTCANCVVHCYSDDMREKVRVVMRWAGPRMLWRHPVLGITHLIDGRRPTPLPRSGRIPSKHLREAGIAEGAATRKRAAARDGDERS
jgi:hypothetical protein